jgi:cytidyltransferase-like protein
MTEFNETGMGCVEEEQTLFAQYTGLNTTLIASIVISSDNMLESCSRSLPVAVAVKYINEFLKHAGVPNKSLLTTDELVLATITIITTLLTYYFLMGKGHSKKRRRLAADLKVAQDKVHFLEERLMIFEEDGNVKSGGEIRIFMDGAFDMMHYGHMNAFRLARSLGTHLVVGVNSDKSITECKGAPLMNDDERMTMVKGCKFVGENFALNFPLALSKLI